MKKLYTFLILTAFLVLLSACSGSAAATTRTDASSSVIDTSAAAEISIEDVTSEISVESGSADSAIVDEGGELTQIVLNGASASITGSGASVNGSVITITAAGTYQINGTLDDGQIIVNALDEDKVVLYLNGVGITSTSSAVVIVENADKTVITLADGSQNYLTSYAGYVEDDEASGQPNAAVYSHDDLTINGSGSLTVYSGYNHGIVSKDDLTMAAANVTVMASRDGIKGKDSITVKDDAIINVTSYGDGMQASNDTDVEKGYVAVESGTINITTGADGIQAVTSLTISSGNITIVSGSGNNTTDSAKGLKSSDSIVITGGTININTVDDAVNANNAVYIGAGDLLLASGDDGLHADASLTIDGGNITITSSYEGIESKVIVINAGTIHLNSSDDGINITTGADGGGMGQGGQGTSFDAYFEINGGYLYINAGGDGLDSNGMGTLNDGVVIVNGPTNNGNGALDVNGMLVVNGGFLVAVGSAGMAQSPSTASTQYSALVQLQSTLSVGTLVHIESQSGEDILTFAPAKEYQTVVITSPEMANGETYLVYTGGSASGTAVDGLYSDGVYTPGSQVSSFTITSIVTGQSSGMGGGGGGGGRPSGGGGHP